MNEMVRVVAPLSSRCQAYRLCRRLMHRPGVSNLWNYCTGDGSTGLQQRRQSNSQASTSGRSHGNIEYILGIESSCDDTGIAVLQASDGRILGHSIASQVDIHAPWGGVVPNLAMEAHRDAMDNTLNEALQQAGLRTAQLDAVAVTIGPGLSLCLKIGVLKAIQLAHEHDLKFLPVHHMEAHALIARQAADVSFPFLCLLVSGGHNMILVAHGVGDYTLLGSTLDDANAEHRKIALWTFHHDLSARAGEAFDKAARLLGLDLRPNGGAALENLARDGDAHRFRFSVPLKKYQDCNFSYAGTKTAVRLAVEEQLPKGPSAANRQVRADIAASFQRVAVAHLAERVARGVEWACADLPEIRHMVVAGGVAANALVRSELGAIASAAGLDFVCPPASLCTDNGVMIAWAGLERLRMGLEEPVPKVPLPGQEFKIDVRPRWPLTDRLDRRATTQQRSQRKSRIFPSLTELTAGARPLAAAA